MLPGDTGGISHSSGNINKETTMTKTTQTTKSVFSFPYLITISSVRIFMRTIVSMASKDPSFRLSAGTGGK